MLSVCIITKNEEEKLNRCLNSLKKYKLEVVIVDTGSTDGTLEMLNGWKQSVDSRFSLVLGTFMWCDDFAKAKNYAVSLAGNPMVLVLDSDETMEELDLSGLQKLMEANPGSLGRILRKNLIEQGGQLNCQQEYINRIFDRRKYKYMGSIHEQLVPWESVNDEKTADAAKIYNEGGKLNTNKIKGVFGEVYPSYIAPVVISHDGYLGTPEQKKQKAQRNILLLQKELKEQGEDPYILYQLGKSYYMQGDYGQAIEYFGRGLTYDLDPRLEYVIDMVETYGYALLNANRPAEALAFEGIYDEFGHTADFRLLMGLIYMNNEMFDEAVGAFLHATESKNARMHGANSFLAYYNAGVVRECLGDTQSAKEYYQKCEGYAPAKERLKYVK